MSIKIDLPQSIRSISDTELRKQLQSYNYYPGPILASTRTVYERKLYGLQTGQKVVAHSAFPPADHDENGGRPPQSPPRHYFSLFGGQPSPPKERQEEKREGGTERQEERREGGTERLIRKPSPRKPLHPDMGDYPRYRTPLGVSRNPPLTAKRKSPPAAGGGRAWWMPSWTMRLVFIIAVAVIAYLVFKNMESDPVSSIPDQIDMV